MFFIRKVLKQLVGEIFKALGKFEFIVTKSYSVKAILVKLLKI